MRKIGLLGLGFGLTLAACGQAAPQAVQPGAGGPTPAPAVQTAGAQETPPATAPGASVTPQILPTATTAPTGAPTQAATASAAPAEQPPDELVQTARQRLAAHLGVSPETLMLQAASQRDWPNGAIGCPKPGAAYTEAIVPGFLLTFSDGSRTYDVHTGASADLIVWCDNQQPVELSSTVAHATVPPQPQVGSPPALVPGETPSSGEEVPLDPSNQPLVELARQSLARDLGISADTINVVKIESVVWNDGSLGCGRPGQVYLQVITPGYRIVLEAQNKHYEYHTDTKRQVVRCDKP